MTVGELAQRLGAVNLSDAGTGRAVTGGFSCDVISQAMARGFRGMAWITVQANMNALAVAVMTGAACLIFPEGMKAEKTVIERAAIEGIALLSAEDAAFELAGRLYAGLRGEVHHE